MIHICYSLINFKSHIEQEINLTATCKMYLIESIPELTMYSLTNSDDPPTVSTVTCILTLYLKILFY